MICLSTNWNYEKFKGIHALPLDWFYLDFFFGFFLIGWIISISLFLFGLVWYCLNLFGFVWISLGMFVFVCVCVRFVLFVCFALCFYGFVWICLDLFWFVWICFVLGFYGFVWIRCIFLISLFLFGIVFVFVLFVCFLLRVYWVCLDLFRFVLIR